MWWYVIFNSLYTWLQITTKKFTAIYDFPFICKQMLANVLYVMTHINDQKMSYPLGMDMDWYVWLSNPSTWHANAQTLIMPSLLATLGEQACQFSAAGQRHQSPMSKSVGLYYRSTVVTPLQQATYDFLSYYVPILYHFTDIPTEVWRLKKVWCKKPTPPKCTYS